MKTGQKNTGHPERKNNMPNTEKKMQQRPDIRDDLDSRKNEEQLIKGDNVTHNKKDNHKTPGSK